MATSRGTTEAGLACIVLVNWNGWRDTAACLESCAGLHYAHVHTIVVDNGSTDDSVARLRERFPELHLLEMGANLGFAGGSNAGIHSALALGADYIWLLNNDTVVDPGALDALVEVMVEHPSVGIAGSRILYLDRPDTLWFAGGFFSRPWGLATHRGADETDEGQYGSLADADFVTGCSLFARASAARVIGPLDERYFLYWEDVDWSVRARLAGLRVVYVPGSRVLHKLGASMPVADGRIKWRYEGRNRLLFYRRHCPAGVPRILLTTLLNAGHLAALGRLGDCLELLHGAFDGVRSGSGQLRS